MNTPVLDETWLEFVPWAEATAVLCGAAEPPHPASAPRVTTATKPPMSALLRAASRFDVQFWQGLSIALSPSLNPRCGAPTGAPRFHVAHQRATSRPAHRNQAGQSSRRPT